MGFDRVRVVQIWSSSATGSGASSGMREAHGSGYRVGPELVLTAAHVLADHAAVTPAEAPLETPGGAMVQVALLDSRQWVPAAVLWRDEDHDVAVLRAAGLPDLPPGSPAPRWGRVNGGDPVVCTAVGFPWATSGPGGRRDTEQLHGFITPLAGAISRAQVITVVSSAPRERFEGRSPWAGMSGAAVFSGRYLVGVVVVDPGRYGTDRAHAVPLAGLLESGLGLAAVLGVDADDLEDVQMPSRLAFTPQESVGLRPPYLPLRIPDPARAPERLLSAQHGVVPFVGRDDELQALQRWCAQDGALALQVVTGESGSGKTRLAAQTCVLMVGEGWDTGFADFDHPGGGTTTDYDRPTLMVVDEADQQVDRIAKLLGRLVFRHERAAPVRMLLVARNTRDWWAEIDRRTDNTLSAYASQPLELTDGELSLEQRILQYRLAKSAFQQFFPADGPAESSESETGRPQDGSSPLRSSDPDLSEGAFANPMWVHLQALVEICPDVLATRNPMSVVQDAESLRDGLELGFVGVLGHQDAVGAGFLIDDEHVITCAHTVNEALGLPREHQERPTAPISAVLPFADRTFQCTGRVVEWQPPRGDPADVAVVQLDRPVPPVARPVQLVDAHDAAGHGFGVWGYPFAVAGERLIKGVIQQRDVDDRMQLVTDAEAGHYLRRGFSGAPVWDQDLGGVVGMVVEVERSSRAGHFIPTDVLARVWPGLGRQYGRGRTPARRVVGERISAGVDVFRDRVSFRSELRRILLSRKHTIVSVTGRRGIGKSGLVARVLADFEDPNGANAGAVGGIAYLSTRTGVGVLDLARVFHALAYLLDDGERERFESLWDNKERDAVPELLDAAQGLDAVIVLDNLDDLQDPHTGQLQDQALVSFFQSMCRTPRPPLAITTSQRPLILPSELKAHTHRIEIDDGIDLAAAVAYVREADSDGAAGLRDAPEEEVVALVEAVHRVPRGLELLVTLRADDPARELDDDPDASAEEVIEELVLAGFTSLGDVERVVVEHLALAGAPVPVEGLESVLEELHPRTTVRKAIRELARRRMLGLDSARVRLHPIDSDFVTRSLADHPEQRAMMDLRLARWLAAQRTEPITWRTSTDVAPQRREFRHRIRAGDEDGALLLLYTIADFLARHGEADRLRRMLDRIPAPPENTESSARYQQIRGIIDFYSGSLSDAITSFGLACASAEAAGRPALSAECNYRLGTAQRHAGRAADGMAPLQEALRITADDDSGRDITLPALFQLALVQCYLRNFEDAEKTTDAMSAALRPSDPAEMWAFMYDARALVDLGLGRLEDALLAVDHGIVHYEDSPNAPNINYLINVRGLIHLALENTGESISEFRSAMEGAQDRGGSADGRLGSTEPRLGLPFGG